MSVTTTSHKKAFVQARVGRLLHKSSKGISAKLGCGLSIGSRNRLQSNENYSMEYKGKLKQDRGSSLQCSDTKLSIQVSSATGNPRNKVALKPGRSLIDWMRLGKSGKDLTGVGGKIQDVTAEELAKHNHEKDAWMALNGKVYNVTPYMEFHPGGISELLRGSGMDATELFNEVHKWVNYESMLAKCFVGKLVTNSTKELSVSENANLTYRLCTVASIESLTHDTKFFKIKLPPATTMCVPIGHHVFISAVVGDCEISKPYTVVPSSLLTSETSDKDGESIHLIIKIYADGLLTPVLGRLKPGDSIKISSCFSGNFKKSQLENCTDIVMIAAGTGFTPMASLLNHCLCRNNLKSVNLIYFNKEEKDIYWKSQLEELSRSHNWFNPIFVLSCPHNDWTGLTGRIRLEILESNVPKRDSGNKILLCVCGPLGFTEEAVRLAQKLNYTDDMIHAFVG